MAALRQDVVLMLLIARSAGGAQQSADPRALQAPGCKHSLP